MRRTLFVIASVLLLVVSGRAQEAATARQSVTEQTKSKPAGFRLKGLDGKTYDTSEFGGEVLAVSFGATWCTPCIWELQAIEELKVEYRGKPVRFFWVSIEDAKETSNNVLRHYVKARRMTVPVLRDPDGSAFFQFTTSTRIPLMVFFDREGNFNAPVHRGITSDVIAYKQLMRRRIDALLNPGEETEGSKVGATGAGANASQ